MIADFRFLDCGNRLRKWIAEVDWVVHVSSHNLNPQSCHPDPETSGEGSPQLAPQTGFRL